MSSPTPPDAADTRSPAYPWLRALGRALRILILATWIGLVGVCVYQYLVSPVSVDTPLALRLALATLFLAGPLWMLGRRLFRHGQARRASLPVFVALLFSTTAFLVWLVRDDVAWRYPDRHPALRNDFPEAAATHALTLRYSKNAPGSLHATLPGTRLGFPSTKPGSANDDAWRSFLAENGPALDALWTELSWVRAWVDELAALPAIGDLTEDFGSPIMDFKSIRLLLHVSCARALQQTAEGRRDEAVATLLPVLAAARKLEPHSRTLVRRMIACVLQSQVQQTLVRVLDSGDISADTRTRLAAALAPRPDPAEGARLLGRCEYETLARYLLSTKLNAALLLSDNASPTVRFLIGGLAKPALVLAYNPHLTVNLAGDHTQAVSEAAARRDFAQMGKLSHHFLENPGARLPGKNYSGRLMLLVAMPAYQKIAERYWETEDERAALLAQITAAP